MQKFYRCFILVFFSLIAVITFISCGKDEKKTEIKTEKLFSELDSNEKKDTNMSTIPMKISSKNFKFLKKDNIDSISMKIQLNQVTTLVDLIDWYLKQGNAAGGPGKINSQDLEEVLKVFNSSLSDYNLEKRIFNDIIVLMTEGDRPWTKIDPKNITKGSSFTSLKINSESLHKFIREDVKLYLINHNSKNPDEILKMEFKNVGELMKAIFKNLK